jgi:hypothetical protein
MSDTIVESSQQENAVTREDLEKMLEEARRERDTIARERDEERTTRHRTERERDELAGHATSEAERAFNAQRQAVESQIATAESEAERAEQEYVRAAEAGDHVATAKAQRAIAAAEAKADRLRGQKDYLEQNKERFTKPPEVRREAPAATDKYAAIVRGLHTSEREWLDQRPQFLNDEKYRQKVFGASQLAGVEHGRGTPEYFRRMEELLGESRQETRTDPPPRERERGQSTDVPPQRRSNPGATPSGGREIRLTADQVEVADGLYGNPSSPDYVADPAERYRKYAGNLERMRASGRLN